MRHVRPARALPMLLLLAVAPACRGTTPTPTPTPTPTLSAAQRRLAAVAQAAATAVYDARYAFTAPATQDSGTIRIVNRPPGVRVDVTRNATTAVFIATPARTVSCTVTAAKKSCFLVARPGEEIPDIFDPGVQRLFTNAVGDLAADPAGYDVTELPGATPSGTSPAAACFRVDRRAEPTASPSPADPSASGFEDGRYCFAAGGYPTLIEVPTGSLRFTALGPAPTDATFVPPAPVAQLPALPSASPSASASPSP